MSFWVVQTINGLSFGMLLFLLAAGLSLVFGLMNITNLAHGSFYMLGAYFGISAAGFVNNLVASVIVGAICIAALGIIAERLVLRNLHGNVLGQVLFTFGILFIISDLSLVAFGGYPMNLEPPALLSGAMSIGDFIFPTYRVFLIVIGLLVAVFLWWFTEGTTIGAAVRATVDDEEMAQAIGLNVPLTATMVFGTGAALAGAGGVIGAPVFGAYPGLDVEVLRLALAVVIIGGLGSLRGAFFGALIVGLLDNFGKALFPEFALFTIFAPMAIVLAIRPSGLFGRAL